MISKRFISHTVASEILGVNRSRISQIKKEGARFFTVDNKVDTQHSQWLALVDQHNRKKIQREKRIIHAKQKKDEEARNTLFKETPLNKEAHLAIKEYITIVETSIESSLKVLLNVPPDKFIAYLRKEVARRVTEQ